LVGSHKVSGTIGGDDSTYSVVFLMDADTGDVLKLFYLDEDDDSFNVKAQFSQDETDLWLFGWLLESGDGDGWRNLECS